MMEWLNRLARLQISRRNRDILHLLCKRAWLFAWLAILAIGIINVDISLGGLAFGPCRTNQRLSSRDGGNTQHRRFTVTPANACQPCRTPSGGYSGAPVSVAARCGDYLALQAILEAGADPNDQFGQMSPMMSLATCKRDEHTGRCAQLLLDYGANIDASDALGTNAMHIAAS
jgi:hypothetical protein